MKSSTKLESLVLRVAYPNSKDGNWRVFLKNAKRIEKLNLLHQHKIAAKFWMGSISGMPIYLAWAASFENLLLKKREIISKRIRTFFSVLEWLV